MKISKVIKWICIFLAFAILLLIVTVALSSIMQGYYKGKFGDLAYNAEWLDRKEFWVTVGQPPVQLYICGVGSLLLTSITALILKGRKNNK